MRFFSILLENAINYSKEDTSIEIQLLEDKNDTIYFEIKDHGIGIEENVQNKIFEEFFRAYNAVSFMQNGTGLGLALAGKIAKIHHAHINVKSRINEGTVFSLFFNKA